MLVQPISTWSIATHKAHWQSPFIREMHIHFCERTNNGAYIFHDDRSIKTISEKQALAYFRDPCLVTLRLISKTALPQ